MQDVSSKLQGSCCPPAGVGWDKTGWVIPAGPVEAHDPGEARGARGRGARGADFGRGRGAQGAGLRPRVPLPTLMGVGVQEARWRGRPLPCTHLQVGGMHNG